MPRALPKALPIAGGIKILAIHAQEIPLLRASNIRMRLRLLRGEAVARASAALHLFRIALILGSRRRIRSGFSDGGSRGGTGIALSTRRPIGCAEDTPSVSVAGPRAVAAAAAAAASVASPSDSAP